MVNLDIETAKGKPNCKVFLIITHFNRNNLFITNQKWQLPLSICSLVFSQYL